MEAGPLLVIALWTAGMAAGAAAVAMWRVAGPGYLWLMGGVVLLFGVGTIVAGGGVWAVLGSAAVAAGAFFARRVVAASVLFGGAALLYAAAAATDSPLVPVLTGAVFLGAVTSEMILGHWYLVDPRLPRYALRRLDIAAGAGLVLDAAYVVARGGLAWDPVDAVIGWAFVALAVMTGLLLVGVWFSLREPSYTGVMAATGLSYLAVLTAIGTAALGRTLTAAAIEA